MFSERLRYARKRKKLTQEQLAAKVSTTKGTISNYENGYSSPSNEMLIDLAEALEVTTDFLLGNDTKDKLPELTPKDERDIAKDLEKILSSLDNPNEGYSHFDGQSIDDLDEEDRELLKAALETSMKIAKQIAKKKYTPKKYKKNDD
ncbi:helix-turn-helix domain-containing protein [Caldibacillus thermoamylovorans]|uniref:helix-turn-helix domain-containing protein n=1 Tax=Caldibacillus thermoamylovorans TaxID=35841 RepID=UPI00203DC860|nr:helix-turn-helix transcriptional regulator [Caldibacillus thermoamylovorans]MCM3053701.1 helix-turn-helix domain-containing protein [Caldibacillus thermoamylovorans]